MSNFFPSIAIFPTKKFSKKNLNIFWSGLINQASILQNKVKNKSRSSFQKRKILSSFFNFWTKIAPFRISGNPNLNKKQNWLHSFFVFENSKLNQIIPNYHYSSNVIDKIRLWACTYQVQNQSKFKNVDAPDCMGSSGLCQPLE